MTGTDSSTSAAGGQAVVSFEKALEQLQFAVRRLETGELPLEEALKGFEEGVRLARICQDQLSAAEQRVEVLVQATEGKLESQPFQGGGSDGPVGPRQG